MKLKPFLLKLNLLKCQSKFCAVPVTINLLISSVAVTNYLFLFQLLSRTKDANVTKKKGQQNKSPVFTSEEVEEHNSPEKGIWVTYKGQVYDITEFIASHPGGPSKIVLAAGGSLEPFWALYAVHNNQHVLDILEEYRIGSLKEDESSHHVGDIKVQSDPMKVFA